MSLSSFLIIPFLAQGLVLFVDEFYFHMGRGLPKWERYGHPLDTISVLLCFLCLVFLPANTTNLYIYVGLCVFSCLFVTKDEFVHKQVCSAFENWLHALLFVLHPIVFFVAGLVWFQRGVFESSNSTLWTGVLIQSGLTAFFLIYQVSYWLILNKDGLGRWSKLQSKTTDESIQTKSPIDLNLVSQSQ